MSTDTHVERRRSSRRTPAADEPLARVRLRAGRHLAVIDVSNGGALVEGEARLLPGRHADVHVVTGEGRLLVRSRIVRAFVVHLEAERILYRGALAFDRTLDTAPPGYAIPSLVAASVPSQGIAYPAAMSDVAASEAAVCDAPGFLT